MSRSTLASVCFLILVVFAAHSCTVTAPTVATKRRSDIELKPCNFPKQNEPALCGKHAVYEDPSAKAGPMIALYIVVLPATGAQPKDDPVFFLSGGPGQGAATIAARDNNPLLRELRRERDLVFVDLRGTGESNRLSCASTADRSVVQNYFAEIFEPATIRACRAALEKRADLKFYTTATAIDDLEEVRAALAYDKINLYGVSYGTLAALQYLRRYPQQLRSVALAGVLTPAAKLPLQFAKGAHRALLRLFDDCAADESCRAAYPDLRADFASVLTAFVQGPVTFELTHPVSKTSQTVSLSRGVFTERLRAMLHGHENARLIPLLINHAAHGNWVTFGRIALASTTPAPFGVAAGVYYNVSCSESVPTIRDEDIARENKPTFLGDYRTRRHQQACAFWPRAEVPADFYEPVKSDLPILMLSGDIDPATPIEFATDASSFLPNARQVLLRNTPHSYTSACARSMIIEFITKASAQTIAEDCAAGLRRPSFLTELPARYNR